MTASLYGIAHLITNAWYICNTGPKANSWMGDHQCSVVMLWHGVDSILVIQHMVAVI